jgi:hypothetical protein
VLISLNVHSCLLHKLCLQSQQVLKSDTESEIIAAGDRALQTKHHATNLLQTETEQQQTNTKFEGTEKHIKSACPLLKKKIHFRSNDGF